MIEINDISKVFRTSEVETVALNHVNLKVKEGEFAAIMGPSGCGKSTLLNILGLLDNPTEGSYKLLGHEVGNLKEKERTRVRKGKLGFVFQSFNLIDELNVYENVELPLTYLGIKASERRRMVEDILKRMNISHRAKHFPQQLSGGQQQLPCRTGFPALPLARGGCFPQFCAKPRASARWRVPPCCPSRCRAGS